MNEIFLDVKELYWANRDVVRIGAAGATVVFAQLLLVLWVLRRLRELSHIRERMSRFADGLALLTDTTEAGLSTLADEIRMGKRPAAAPASRPAATRAHVAKRVAAAARKGERLNKIAEREALSESEVRLHLSLSESEAARSLHGLS
jgi:hypothetical protein